MKNPAIEAAIKTLKDERQIIDQVLAALEKLQARIPSAVAAVIRKRAAQPKAPPVKKRGPYKKTRERLAATNKAFSLQGYHSDDPFALQGYHSDDPKCGRGECTHQRSEHNKSKDLKCSRCWCYGFVQRAA